jgi:hypothetical protein
VHQARPLPEAGSNPKNFLVEHPTLSENWDRAVYETLENRYGTGSPQKNLQAWEAELASLPEGSGRRPGTNRHFARQTYNSTRQRFWKNEAINPSFDYCPDQLKNLAAGRRPDPSWQIHHFDHISKHPEKAISTANMQLTQADAAGNFRRGTPHHGMHYGENAKRLQRFEEAQSIRRASRVAREFKMVRLLPIIGTVAGLISANAYAAEGRDFRAALALGGIVFEPLDWLDMMLPDDPTSLRSWIEHGTIQWGPPPPIPPGWNNE